MPKLAFRKTNHGKGKHYILPKKLRDHCIAMGIDTLAKLRTNLVFQNESWKRSGIMACYECREIARKLGIDPNNPMEV